MNLLRVIENREIRIVGSFRESVVGFRVCPKFVSCSLLIR